MKNLKNGAATVWQRAYLWACERLYHEFAWGYDAVAWGVSGGRWAVWRRAVLPWVQGPNVLEIGFGTAALLHDMAVAGYKVVGIDNSSAMQRQAARRDGLRATRIQADAQLLPLADGLFDTVVATFPAPYITEVATLTEVARVLKPGGRLVVGGLWVAAASPIDRRPVTARTPSALLLRMGMMLRAGGLAMAVTEAAVGGAHVGIVIAHKAGAVDASG